MLIPFSQLKEQEISLSRISVIRQTPTYRLLNMQKRTCNGFIYLLQGQCSFRFAGGEFTMEPGALAYLPLGSRHVFQMEGETVTFFRVDFHVHCGQEPVFFSQLPMKLTDAVTAQCDQDIRELAQLCTAQQNTVEKNARLFSVFSQLCKAVETPCAQRLLPAVNYLHQNLTKPLDCQQLAALCFVSTTRFYKLFKAQFGTTPLGYRDQLLTERAAMLLQMEDLSIREVADLLGFSDPAYFSRFFKKQTGRSPAQYRAGLQQNP